MMLRSHGYTSHASAMPHHTSQEVAETFFSLYLLRDSNKDYGTVSAAIDDLAPETFLFSDMKSPAESRMCHISWVD